MVLPPTASIRPLPWRAPGPTPGRRVQLPPRHPGLGPPQRPSADSGVRAPPGRASSLSRVRLSVQVLGQELAAKTVHRAFVHLSFTCWMSLTLFLIALLLYACPRDTVRVFIAWHKADFRSGRGVIHSGSRAGPPRLFQGLGVWAGLSSWLCARSAVSFPVMTSPHTSLRMMGAGGG